MEGWLSAVVKVKCRDVKYAIVSDEGVFSTPNYLPWP